MKAGELYQETETNSNKRISKVEGTLSEINHYDSEVKREECENMRSTTVRSDHSIRPILPVQHPHITCTTCKVKLGELR